MLKHYSNTLLITLFFGTHAIADHHESTQSPQLSPNESLAKAWVESSQSLESAREMIAENMADDGVWAAKRYVGFGFDYDTDNEEEMVVRSVRPNSPAEKVLQAGDIFVSVNGVAATQENRDRLSFRGKPGQAVKARISRAGEEMDIEVSRGVISPTYAKQELLKNMATADAENWGPTEMRISEILSSGNVVYVLNWGKDVEQDTGLEFESWAVTRFEFNEAGQVIWAGELSEDRFVLEQLGYSISR